MGAVLVVIFFVLGAGWLEAQTGTEEFSVYGDRPRLILKPQRLRLLRRERERQSARWQVFDTFISGGAQTAEPGLSSALHYLVSGSEASGRKAIGWAMSATDLRQVALVYDWCHSLLSEAQGKQLAAKLSTGKSVATDIPAIRTKVLAAIASGDGSANTTLKYVVEDWWRKNLAPALKSGKRILAHQDVYPLFEILHAIRDNLQIDLRDDARKVFQELPAERLLSYYPATYPASENDFRIPYFEGKGEPDLRTAAMSRVAELAMVAYDTNSVESQFLQGWLLHDRFLLRGVHSVAYEFLWANPYQPGLSFHHMPLRLHDSRSGRFFVRSTWEEDATWAAYSAGRLQVFQDGKIAPGAIAPGKPLLVGETGIASGPAPLQLTFTDRDPLSWFIVGLSPSKLYDVEIEDEGLSEARADRVGIISLPPLRGGDLALYLHEANIKD